MTISTLVLMVLSGSGQAQSSLTLGAGAGLLSLPEYPGADQQATLFSPFPFFDFRNKYVAVSRDGLMVPLSADRRWQMVFNFSGTPPVTQSEDSVRNSMPELDGSLEIGAALQWQNQWQKPRWRWLLPVRRALAGDLSRLYSIGYRLNPKVERFWYWENHGPDASATQRLGLTIGSYWNSRQFNQYYYGVETAFAQPARNAYDADQGYGGSYTSLSYRYAEKNWFVGSYAQWHVLNGSSFDQSPLLAQRHGVTVGVVFVRKLVTKHWP